MPELSSKDVIRVADEVMAHLLTVPQALSDALVMTSRRWAFDMGWAVDYTIAQQLRLEMEVYPTSIHLIFSHWGGETLARFVFIRPKKEMTSDNTSDH